MSQLALPSTFAAARPVAEHLDAVEAALAPYDFVPERTFAAVSLCRDELTQALIGDIAQRWDQPFCLGGLGGLPSLGRTGWNACLSHVPHRGGRGHLVVLGFPHIGIGPLGELGESLRRHQDLPTPTCGALMALHLQLAAPQQAVAPTMAPAMAPAPAPEVSQRGLADAEAARLRELVTAELDGPPCGIDELTFAAAAAVRHEMWRELEALAPWEEMDVAVFTGIQIHMPDEPDRLLHLDARVRVGSAGDEHRLEL